ncbi:MAG: cytochrome c1 [Pontixanthobacter sp.]
MIRIGGILLGIGFTIVVLFSFITGAYNWATEEKQTSAEYVFYKAPKDVGFPFDGALAKWDLAQLQRGYQVYKEVCAACHGMKFVAFRDFAEIGYTEDEVKAIAAEWQTIPGIDPDTGEAIVRAGEPTDYIPSPYPNAVAAAAANNNAIPPDLSLMAKARGDGSAYIYSLLTGYGPIPAELKKKYPDFTTPDGLYFNQYFPNLNIAMAPPITTNGQVTYADGTEATIGQMSKDVAAFMTWTAEPTLVERKRTGWPVLGFLLFATVLAYFAKKQVWASAKRKKTD